MSEYQFYEFQAIDRPLDDKALAELRTVSSRARITPTSFVNVYNYGNFRGDPQRLMEKYFDAFLQIANWGTHRLMLRLPRRLVDVATARLYCIDDNLTLREQGEHVLLEFLSQEEGGTWEEGEGVLSPLLPIRNDLLVGDLRSLYLGWLAGIDSGEVDDDIKEPPLPPGMSQLTAALKSLAEFLRIDTDLIEVAAAPDEGAAIGPSVEDLMAWITSIPEADKNAILLRLVQGEGALPGLELRRRFQEEQAKTRSDSARPQRTVAELLAARDEHADEGRHQEAEEKAREQAKRAREQAAARAKYLDSIAGRDKELWQQVEAAIATKQAKEYDRAVALLQDLRDLAERSNSQEAVSQHIQHLRTRHRSKRTLIQRLDRAGFPK